MRPIGLVLSVILILTPLCFASGSDKPLLDPSALAALVTKANLASPKEQCYLYAELVHQMAERAGQELNQGEDPTAALRAVREYTQKIHLGAANDPKKLKNAQILMEHTAYRLNVILHSSDLEERPLLESTLKTLNQVQSELMMQVFRR